MPEEKTLDFNSGEESTPADGGQSDNNAPGADSTDLGDDIDSIIADSEKESDKDVNLTPDDDEADTIVVSTAKLKKLQTASKNYKKGLLSIKGKIKKGEGEKKTEKKEEKPEKKPDAKKKEDQTLTVKDFQDRESKRAIKKACADKDKGKEMDENWKDIMKYYRPLRSKDDADEIVKDIFDAHTIWKSKQKKDDKEGDEGDKKARAALAKEKGEGGGGDEGGKKDEKGRKRVLPKRTPVQEWYKKSEKKE